MPVALSKRALAVLDSGRGWEPPTGAYRLSVGRSLWDVRLEEQFEVSDESRT